MTDPGSQTQGPGAHTSRGLYSIVIPIWVGLMIIYEALIYYDSILPILKRQLPAEVLLVLFNQIFVSFFFFFGISNLAIAVRYLKVKEKVKQAELALLKQPLPKDWTPKVQLLYTTYNDFIPYAFLQCLQQSYPNTQGVILDNSTDPHYLRMIDQFVKVHPEVKLVRDQTNREAKAGNLNHYLCHEGRGTYDYFVILDSDELLEKEFVEKCLKMFYYSDIGILQCNHISGQNYNSFMATFSRSGNIFWPVQNVVRSAESGWRSRRRDILDHMTVERVDVVETGGALCIELGHGVMISRECFEDIGQIPNAVAEDLCTSVEALLKGWNIKFASQIYGNEAFPVNMSALLIRSSKFCSANFEFFQKYAKKIMKTRVLSFYQKLDLFCFTLSVPICAFQYLSLVMSSILFPLLHISLVTQLVMLAPVLVCYFSQSLVDGIFQVRQGMNFFKMLLYELETTLLYGSFYYITVKSTLFALLNRPARFVVTPKVNERVRFREALKTHWQGIVFSVVTILVCIDISRASWVLLSFLPGCFGFLFELKANHQTQEAKAKAARFREYNASALCAHHPQTIRWDE